MMPPAPSIAERSGENVARGALGKTLEAGDYEILRLAEPRFDIDRLVAALERVRRRFPLRPRNDDPTYRGICLQTSGDTDDPLYGLVNLRPARERPAVEPTAIAGEFAAVFAALSPMSRWIADGCSRSIRAMSCRSTATAPAAAVSTFR